MSFAEGISKDDTYSINTVVFQYSLTDDTVDSKTSLLETF